jgi:hypothetical protein
MTLDAWLTLWSQHNDKSQDSNLGYWLGLFGLFGIVRAATLIFAI